MDDAKSVMQEVIGRWKARDRDGVIALADEGVTFVDEPTGRQFVGREEYARVHYDRWVDAYPDHELLDTLVFAEGDLACLVGRFAGTHTGVYRFPGMPDLPPTGKRIDGPFAVVAEIEGGKVLSLRHFYDRLRVLEEEGILTVDTLFAQLPVS